MTIVERRDAIANLPDDMPVVMHGYENGFDRLTTGEVRVLMLAPDVAVTLLGVSGPHWYDGEFEVADRGVPHLAIGATARIRRE